MAKANKPVPADVQKEQAKTFEVSPSRLREFLSDLNAAVESARNDREGWEQQLVSNYEWRKGQIGRPFPDLPFRGASDLRFPLIDKYIDTLKSSFFLSVIDAPHTMRFLPLWNPKQAPQAGNLELFEDAYFLDDNEWRRTVAVLLDRLFEQGRCVAKITHEYQCEPESVVKTRDEVKQALTGLEAQRLAMAAQTGAKPKPVTDGELRELLAEEFEWDLENPIHKKRADDAVRQIRDQSLKEIKIIRDRIASKVKVRPVHELVDVIVPLNCGALADAEWVAHDQKYTPRQLRQMSDGVGGPYRNVEEVIERCRGKTGDENTPKEELESAQEQAERVDDGGSDEDQITVRELCCWVPVKEIERFNDKTFGNDETPVRAVLTYCPGAFDIPLRLMELPYEHGRWPFEECTFRFGRLRYYDCQGVPQRMEAIAAEYNISRNAAINHATITLCPPVVVSKAAKINASSFRQVGQVLQSNIPADQAISMPRFPDISSGFEVQAQSLEQFTNEYLGMPDLRMRGYDRPPTAAQVNQVSAPAGALMRYDLEHFHDFLGRVFRQVFELQKQYMFALGEQKYEFANPSSPDQGLVVTKEDFDGKYVIQSGADLQRLDDTLNAQMMFIAYQAAMNQPQIAGMVDPYQVNYTFFNKTLGPIVARQWMKSRKEAEVAQQQFMQQQAMAAMQQQATGRNPRNMKFKQVPNAQAGIVPQ